MSKKSFDEIFTTFEEISNSYKRSDQYFDILYDSASSTRISKTRSSEDISVNTKKSGIVARTYLGKWKEITFENLSSLKKIGAIIPRTTKHGKDIVEFDGWMMNQEIIQKIDPSKIPIEDKIDKIRYI